MFANIQIIYARLLVMSNKRQPILKLHHESFVSDRHCHDRQPSGVAKVQITGTDCHVRNIFHCLMLPVYIIICHECRPHL